MGTKLLRRLRKGFETLFFDPNPPSSIYAELMHKDRDFVIHKFFLLLLIACGIDTMTKISHILSTPDTLIPNAAAASVTTFIQIFMIFVIRRRKTWNRAFFLKFEITLTSCFLVFSIIFSISFQPEAKGFPVVNHILVFGFVLTVLHNRLAQFIVFLSVLPVLARLLEPGFLLDSVHRLALAFSMMAIMALNCFSVTRSMRVFAKSFEDNEEKAFLLEQMQEAILIFDKHDKLIFNNKAITNILEDLPEEQIKHLSTFIPQICSKFTRMTFLQKINGKNDQMGENGTLEAEPSMLEELLYYISMARKSTKTRDKKIASIRIEAVYHAKTIAEEKTLEFELRSIRFMNSNNLLLLIKDVTQIKQVSKLKALDQYKDMLLASVTHELRTPLNCIIPMITEAIDDENVPTTLKENSLKPSINSARLLLNLVNDILDYSRFKRKKLKLNFGEFNVYEKLSDIIRLFEIQCRHKGLQLRFEYSADLPINMYGDKDRLGQVIINFLSNALKFTSKGSIGLIVEPSKKLPGFAVFSVVDTGIGIKHDNLEKLFTEFGKLEVEDHAALNPQGVGLGLMISNQITMMLGSRDGIQVTSTYGEGTQFYFEIPIEKGDAIKGGLENNIGEEIVIEIIPEVRTRPCAITDHCDCKRVFSVDDNDYNQMVMGRTLTRFKFQVTKAFNGADALKIMKDPASEGIPGCGRPNCTVFNLIVTDLHMPIMNGMDLIREVRKLPGLLGQIPIILLSASDEKEQVEEGIKAGMNDFITKPFAEEALKGVLRGYNLIE